MYQAYTNQTVTGTALTQLSNVCGAVDKAIKNELKREIERRDYSMVLAAPMTPNLRLFRYAPIVISTLEVYLNTQAGGDPDEFTADNLLTLYGQQGYTLTPDPLDPTLCSNGVITRRNGYWGVQYYLPVYSVSAQQTPLPGAIKVVMTAGYEEVPADLVQAAVVMTTKILKSQKQGGQYTSESWNGYSFSLPSAAKAALQDEQVTMTLDLYRAYGEMI